MNSPKLVSAFSIKTVGITLTMMLPVSALCSLLSGGGLAQLPYFLFLLLTVLLFQGFEVFRQYFIKDSSGSVAEIAADWQKRNHLDLLAKLDPGEPLPSPGSIDPKFR